MLHNSQIVTSTTADSGDACLSGNNQEQNISSPNDLHAVQDQESTDSAKMTTANNTSGPSIGSIRNNIASGSDDMGFARGRHDGTDPHLTQHFDSASKVGQNSATGDAANLDSAAAADRCDSGSASQTSGAATADTGSTPSNSTVIPANGAPDSSTGPSDPGCGLSTGGGSTSVTNQGSATGSMVTASSITEPSNSVPGLAPASGSGAQGDDLNNVASSALTGTGGADSSSSGPTVTPDTTPPAVTDALGADGVTVNGEGNPNTAVTISESGQVIGNVESNATGAWSFNAASLDPGAHSLVASETDPAGNTGSASPLAVTIPDPRFDVTNTVTAASILLHGIDYVGPVDHLQAAYNFTGTDSSVISALVGNVFIQAGAGENAAVAKDGNNVLAGSDGSSWLVGASGADGGSDTFFVSAQGNQPAWDTLVNFHVGDMLTLWGFNSASGSTSSVGNQGTSEAKGETIGVNFGQGSGASTLVTFAGLSSNAQFTSTTGSTGGLDYSMLTRTA